MLLYMNFPHSSIVYRKKVFIYGEISDLARISIAARQTPGTGFRFCCLHEMQEYDFGTRTEAERSAPAAEAVGDDSGHLPEHPRTAVERKKATGEKTDEPELSRMRVPGQVEIGAGISCLLRTQRLVVEDDGEKLLRRGGHFYCRVEEKVRHADEPEREKQEATVFHGSDSAFPW